MSPHTKLSWWALFWEEWVVGRGHRMWKEQIGCQVKMDCCALSNQLKTLHECFLTNNTCGCWNSSGNLSNILFSLCYCNSMKFILISEESTCRWLSTLDNICQTYFHCLQQQNSVITSKVVKCNSSFAARSGSSKWSIFILILTAFPKLSGRTISKNKYSICAAFHSAHNGGGKSELHLGTSTLLQG